MTFVPGEVTYQASEYTDAFHRLRVSQPQYVFDSLPYAGNLTIDWESALTDTGTITDDATASTINLNTGGTASGAKVVRQSRAYFLYQPAKSQLMKHTFVFNAGKTNLRQRVGYFDGTDGIYIEMSGTAVSLNIISSTGVTSPVFPEVPESGYCGEFQERGGSEFISLGG